MIQPNAGFDTSARPIDADEFAAAMESLAGRSEQRIAVAVSGGADSMALAVLLRDWCRGTSIALHALTVDHGLRPESASEAARVSEWMKGLGVPHSTLNWADGPAAARREASAQADARSARYRLLTAWCRSQGVSHLAVGHHAEDQVETFLMRLARGSGLAGLASMAPSTVADGIVVIRPLLAEPKARLEATVRAAGHKWITDPSNTNAAYGRARFRAARGFLAAEGLTDERLLATIAHLRRAQLVVDDAVDCLSRTSVSRDTFGAFSINAARLMEAPLEVGLRLLTQTLIAASGGIYGPRFDAIARLHSRLFRDEQCRATLSGCVVTRSGGTVRVFREAAAIDDRRSFSPGDDIIWDGRFRLKWRTSISSSPRARAEVVRMQSEHWILKKREQGFQCLEDIPAALRLSLPVVVLGRQVIAVPHAPKSHPESIEIDWVDRDLSCINAV